LATTGDTLTEYLKKALQAYASEEQRIAAYMLPVMKQPVLYAAWAEVRA
jgi:hypothetical protein